LALAIFNVTKKPASPIVGGDVEVIHQVTLDTDYAAGGYAITAAQLGLSSIDFVDCPGNGGYVCQWDYANSKLKVLYGNNDAADGPLIEVADGHDGIADLTVRLLARGRAA
jgi:hypothetical protein